LFVLLGNAKEISGLKIWDSWVYSVALGLDPRCLGKPVYSWLTS
jgi:hypothetical protein